MDRSLDSIGSCSLDVDADSSDISDTSGSLNFPTPLSVKDITREFTANIRERCTLRSPQQPQYTTAYVDPLTGQVRMVLTPSASSNVEHSQNAANASLKTAEETSTVSINIDAGLYEKKPSYLNLACCVNGYSNLTTYDSKIRQDINKSREVSPIRPSTSSLQYCKKNNSLAAPVLLTMPNATTPLTKQPSPGSKYTLIETNNNNNNKNGHHIENGSAHSHNVSNGSTNGDVGKHGTGSASSFIKQRVERLYGPGALAQGFYSPKKHGLSPVSARGSKQSLEVESPQSTELARKFKQLSPGKDYGEFRKKLDNNCAQTATARQTETQVTIGNNGDVDLPVFRHLSHEFRAQLPTVSPKRNVSRISPAPEVPPPILSNGKCKNNDATSTSVDTVDHEAVQVPQLRSEEYISTTKILSVEPMPAAIIEKDGNYFLKILKSEQSRLLVLAAEVDKYTDALTNNPDITEDTFGLLRSASGKARLLVSQKMKQFEGLCHKNLNRSPEDAFPTTVDDLQGFWDMVNLQVAHIDSIFADIEQLKSNDWKRKQDPVEDISLPSKSTKLLKTGNSKSKTSLGNQPGNASPKSSNSAAALKREAQRKQLLEMKRQRREAMAAIAKNQTACDGVVELQDAAGDSVNIAVDNSS
ncbi:uncharacterized protein LOC115632727 isoform X2 [Scaptodrosophila lebanonensis]|uniref:Uncharacterized protein LOC115632727 isoform X2 n=1 Tax=Drosophila lebanonensis TaxID=7225 RepID=A0A6J2UBU9_DROLE|nr:uncharacterized protein LOC115632727 isoform X2 [Scaptodrosophila lebanonensis]